MQVIFEFLRAHSIQFNKKTVKDYLSTHPYFPGFLGISDLLDEFSVENAVLKISEDRFNDIPLPFIAQTSSVEGTFVLVKKIQNNTITYLNEAGMWNTRSLSEFNYSYSGIVLVAEADTLSGENDYLITRKKILIIQAFKIIQVMTVISLLMTAFFYHQNPFMQGTALIFCLKITGLVLSILLLIQTYGGMSWIDKFCRDTKGNNCKDVLLSAGATIFYGAVSWAEIGFFYFAITVLAMILYPPGAGISLITCLNFFCIPYTIYSVWYQWRKVKAWCRLCLIVQLVLWLELIACILVLQNFPLSISYMEVYWLVTIGLILISLWSLIRPHILNSSKVKELIRTSNLFKRDEFIFNTLLRNQEEVDISSAAPLILGDPDARFEITIVTNPICRPCMNVQREALQLLESYPDSIKLSIIFKPSITQLQQKEGNVNQLVAAYLQCDKHIFQDIIKSWVNSKSGKIAIFPALLNDPSRCREKVAEIILSQRNWCEKHSIFKTPTVFINGYGAVPGYDLKDLRPFIMANNKPK